MNVKRRALTTEILGESLIEFDFARF